MSHKATNEIYIKDTLQLSKLPVGASHI